MANLVEECPEGSQERRRLSLSAILKVEDMAGRHTPIRDLFDRWRAGADFDDARWIDVRSTNPYDFVIHNHPGTVIGGRSEIILKDYPVRMQARSCAAEYWECKSINQPVAHYVNQEFHGLQREYVRLMIPIADPSGLVQKIVYAIRHLRQP